jgi:hypothetical protein
MKKIITITLALVLIQTANIKAQESGKYLPEKPGKWTYSSNIKSPEAEVAAFNKNLANLAEWFHQNVPLLANTKGFDLSAVAFGIWDDDYKKNPTNYGMRSEMNFDFQLFLSSGGKWTIEPPHWNFDVNNTESGHGGMNKEGTAGSFLNSLFTVFPFVKELAPGVHYYDCENRTCGSLVVFNPNRPDYWIPVTVREVVKEKLVYYKEKDKMIYDFIKPLIDKMSEQELNSPAFNLSDDGILKVNGKGDGLQYMRFNPDYWDKSMPPSAIQFLTFYYPQRSQEETDEFFTNNGHPIFGDVILCSIKLEELEGLIMLRK